MESFVEKYWKLRLQKCKKALEANHFGAHVTETTEEAKTLVIEEILPKTGARTVSWGDSMTFYATGLLDYFQQLPDIELIETFDSNRDRDELIERRRQALLSDLFFTGSNAVTEAGHLVNLDMIGNRVAGITFGPRQVVILAGRNKIVSDLNSAMFRIKNSAAPLNAIRHELQTPCVKTGRCMDCKNAQRICNTWTITEKSFPERRIQVVLINKDLGL